MAKRKPKRYVRVEINHPNFQADCILAEAKAFTYLKRIKKTFKDNLKIITSEWVHGKESLSVLNVDRETPIHIGPDARMMNVDKYNKEMELKGYSA